MVCHVLFIVLRKKKVKVLFTFRILFVKIHVVLTYLLSSKHKLCILRASECNIIYWKEDVSIICYFVYFFNKIVYSLFANTMNIIIQKKTLLILHT